jgi:hypothetical protein
VPRLIGTAAAAFTICPLHARAARNAAWRAVFVRGEIFVTMDKG